VTSLLAVRVRLAFPASFTSRDVLNGAWWPRTRDPAAELPALVDAVASRLGVVRRIALNADAWDFRPRRLVIHGGSAIRLDWSAGGAHTVRLTGGDASHLDLLAIPFDTATVLALACLARAARDVSPMTGGRSAAHPEAGPLRAVQRRQSRDDVELNHENR
jgi:Family of unknown function (DUF5994)